MPHSLFFCLAEFCTSVHLMLKESSTIRKTRQEQGRAGSFFSLGELKERKAHRGIDMVGFILKYADHKITVYVNVYQT